jgi:antitoxin component YwqK of YwqJK toxin-antitoxin module
MKEKKYYTIIILVFSFMGLFAQERNMVVKYFPGMKEIKEKYFTINNVMDGEYLSYFQVPQKSYEETIRVFKNDSSFIKEEGVYRNGVKDSIWVEYAAPFTKRIKSTGKYKNNMKVGVWQTYIEGGNVLERYDYDSNKHLPYLLNISLSIEYPEKAN